MISLPGAVIGIGIVAALTGVNLMLSRVMLSRVVRALGQYTDRIAEHNHKLDECQVVLVEIHRTNLALMDQHDEMLRRIEILREGEAA